jgi:DNA-binding Lrp family transcriptional regulator
LGEILYKVDSLDCKIILALQKNARMTFSDLAKEINEKPGVVQARYHQMVRKGIIKGSTLSLNNSKIGFPYSCGLEIKVVSSMVDEVIAYIKRLKIKNTFHVVHKVIGQYNILVIIDCSTLMDVYKLKDLIKRNSGVIQVNINVNKAFYINYEGLISQLQKMG